MADYVEQYARDRRKSMFPTENFFWIIFRLAEGADSLHAVAERLNSAGRHFLAAQFYHRALSLGYVRSAWNLAECLDLAKDLVGAITVLEGVAETDERSSDYLIQLLVKHGQVERVEELCSSEFEAGNARPLVAAAQGFRSIDAMQEYWDMADRIVKPDTAAPAQLEARLKLFAKELEIETANIEAAIGRLKDEVEAMGNSARDRVRAIESQASIHEAAGRRETANLVLISALNAEVIGVEMVASMYGRWGEPDGVESIERFGVDAAGVPVAPWSLTDLT